LKELLLQYLVNTYGVEDATVLTKLSGLRYYAKDLIDEIETIFGSSEDIITNCLSEWFIKNAKYKHYLIEFLVTKRIELPLITRPFSSSI
jgi:hypothetical protein